MFDGFATLGANATEILWPQVDARVNIFKTAILHLLVAVLQFDALAFSSRQCASSNLSEAS